MRPLVLVSPSIAAAGVEMPDPSISVAGAYLESVIRAGGVPVSLPLSDDPTLITDAIAQAHGLLLTGGEDIEPTLHRSSVSEALRATCFLDHPTRDSMELALIREAFRRRMPVFAICRGHQLVNVALGGSLYVDLPGERPGNVQHNQVERRFEAVHRVHVESNSILARLVEGPKLGVNSTHHQAVNQPAPGLRAVAWADDGVVEAMEWDSTAAASNGWFLSVQFHPERLAPTLAAHARLFEGFITACRAATSGRIPSPTS